ncbi:MAG: ABC transporter permease [Candidatus Marinarcus sp.]|uniref:ABC transporter permease n=1 Tax=Candidatus Marinarcus sp. TaxID=3100987 RepID=UPI003B0026ED
MQTIPYENLTYALIPLAFVWYFYAKWTHNKTEIVVATTRMVIQLLLIGYLLIFIFENKHIYVGMGIITFMIIISSFITMRNSKEKTAQEYFIILSSIAISGLVHLVIMTQFVLDLPSLYEPRFVIPIAGMIFANTMNCISIAIERFSKELVHQESFENAREASFKAALIPQINSLLAVGLVSLPGMMTGQILSGVDPMIAVRYQIMIMSMILSNAGIAIVIYFTLKQKVLAYKKS